MSQHREFNLERIRQDFPFLTAPTGLGRHYLDNAATSQKPQAVIEAMSKQLIQLNANVHRGVYRLSEQATVAFETSRKKVAGFLGGVKLSEVIFTSGTTEAINLIARSYGDQQLKAGDEILLTVAEHHSNIIPWQLLAKRSGATLRYIPLDPSNRLDLDIAQKMLTKKTKIVAFAHVSNVLGYINPVKKLAAMARQVGAISLVDGAQAAPHLSINVDDLGCDFYAFSSHKMLGPSGVGVLYGREQLLEAMPPFLGGGEMINKVDLHTSTWAALPHKFEAGTPAITEVIALGAAIDYLQQFAPEDIHRHVLTLSRTVVDRLKQDFPEVRIFCEPGDDWLGIVAFHHQRIHAHDLAAIADSFDVCIRAGHHCAQPLMSYLKVDASSRVSPYLYNNRDDIEQFFAALTKARTLL